MLNYKMNQPWSASKFIFLILDCEKLNRQILNKIFLRSYLILFSGFC